MLGINTNRVVTLFGIFLNFCYVANGQGLDLHRLSREAFSKGATVAATYLFYADYLKNPDDFDDFEITAYLLTKMNEFEKAESLLQHVDSMRVHSAPDSLRLYYYMCCAQTYYNNNEYVRALSMLACLPEGSDDDLKARCYSGLALYEKAIRIYMSLVTEDNKDIMYCNIADCYRDLGQYNESMEYYSAAMEVDPKWHYPYYGRGWSYELSGNDEKAMEDYEKGIALDQTDPYLFLMRGEMYLKLGQKDMAEEDFRTVLRLDKEVKDGSCRHYALFFLGRNEHAMNWMNRIIEYEPNDCGHYYDKACLCCRMGLYDEAVNAMASAFEMGYRKFRHLDADDDINPIKEREDYKQLYEKYHKVYESELEKLNCLR